MSWARKKTRYRPCVVCGDLFRVKPNSTRKHCNKCIGIPVRKAIKQIKNRKGKTYEKWKQGIQQSLNL